MSRGAEWLASGSNDTPLRTLYHPSSFREKGSCPVRLLPPHRLLLSFLLLELIGKVRGYEWMARHIFFVRLTVPCQIHLYKSCPEQKEVGTPLLNCRYVQKMYQFDRFALDCVPVLHLESSCIAFQRKAARAPVYFHQRRARCDSCWLRVRHALRHAT